MWARKSRAAGEALVLGGLWLLACGKAERNLVPLDGDGPDTGGNTMSQGGSEGTLSTTNLSSTNTDAGGMAGATTAGAAGTGIAGGAAGGSGSSTADATSAGGSFQASTPTGSSGGAAGGGGGAGGESTDPEVCLQDRDCREGYVCDESLECLFACESPTGVTLRSEANLLAFAELGCERLDGDLAIQAPELENLELLAPSPLRVVTGDLTLSNNPALLSVAGLAGLARIEGSLIISGNDSLVDLSGLDALEQLGSEAEDDSLVLHDNGALEDASALESLQRMATSIVVNDNPVLTNLSGFEALRVTTSVTIVGNAALETFHALPNLQLCNRTMTFASNPSLGTVGLPSLVQVDSLNFTDHQAVTDLQLPSLTRLGSLTVANNPSLERLEMSALSQANTLVIASNPSLPQCLVDAIDAGVNACTTCTGNDDLASCE